MSIHKCLSCQHSGKVNQMSKIECAMLNKTESVLKPIECSAYNLDQVKLEAAIMTQISNIAGLHAAGGDLARTIQKIEERIKELREHIPDV